MASCTCAQPGKARAADGSLIIEPDCPYHQEAAARPMDHSIPWNCPTYWDGCNCSQTLHDLREELKAALELARDMRSQLPDDVAQQQKYDERLQRLWAPTGSRDGKAGSP